MIAFIDDHRALYGVEPICRVLPIAPSTDHAHAARRTDLGKLPRRAKRDAALMAEVRRVHAVNFGICGVRKVWRPLAREGIAVARCTVARLMRALGLAGVVRGRRVPTTVPDPAAACPLDRVNRQFRAECPNRLWVADFTYVATWVGFVYAAFVIDVFAHRIVGWRVSRSVPGPTSCSMLWSRRCTSAAPPPAVASSAIPTAGRNAPPNLRQHPRHRAPH